MAQPFNPFELKSVFSPVEAACAVVGVVDHRDSPEAVRAVFRELVLQFPPVARTAPARRTASGTVLAREWTEHAKIPRADLLAWCEQKGVRPPLLFPEPPPEPDLLSNKAAYTAYTLLAAALVQQYGRDALCDRPAFIKEWQSDLAKGGIELPIKDNRTLVSAIEKAALKVDSLYPE